jgi:hypothetical protein
VLQLLQFDVESGRCLLRLIVGADLRPLQPKLSYLGPDTRGLLAGLRVSKGRCGHCRCAEPCGQRQGLPVARALELRLVGGNTTVISVGGNLHLIIIRLS